MTEILNDLDLEWCAFEPASKIWLWFAVGSRFVVPFSETRFQEQPNFRFLK